jgi:response regulator RpfG family c-di-GMP phosphodiesterase
MKLSPETSNIPVIVVTAKPEADSGRRKWRCAGWASNIIYKPFDLNQLVHVVKQTIG